MTSCRPHHWSRRPVLLAAALAGAAWLAACVPADSDEPTATPSSGDLSDALAFRDGAPSIEVVSPADGETVVSPVVVEVEASNFALRPSGTTKDGEGHLHVLVDEGCVEPGLVIPSSGSVTHAGDGSDSVTIELSPGRHELCAQIGDGFHVAVAINDRIVINVVDPDPAEDRVGRAPTDPLD